MSAEIPPTPRFTATLEERLREEAAAGTPKGSAPRHGPRCRRLGDIVVPAMVATACAGAVAFVLVAGGAVDKDERRAVAPSGGGAAYEDGGEVVRSGALLGPRGGSPQGFVKIATDSRACSTRHEAPAEVCATVAIDGLPPRSDYVMWLDGRFQGFLPPAEPRTGRLSGDAVLEEVPDVGAEVLVTREPTARPKEPGEVVLRGRLDGETPGQGKAQETDALSGAPRRTGQMLPPTGGLVTATARLTELVAGDARALRIRASGLPRARTLALWFAGEFVGFVPGPSDDGALKVTATVPPLALADPEVLLTRETTTRPDEPGEIVLRGKLDGPPGG